MNTHKRSSAVSLFLGLMLIVIPVKAFPGVIHGTGVLTHAEWDFSDSAAVHCLCGDIYVAYVFDPPRGWVVYGNLPPYQILYKWGAAVFDTLRYAPGDTSLYDYWAPVSLDATYVVRTGEGHWAKFRITSFVWAAVIEYVYQPDGSLRFFDEIGVEHRTWGSIKALYR